MVSAAFNYVTRPAATTFVFPSVFILLLCTLYRNVLLFQDNLRTEEFPAITADTLKMEKGFVKAVKKHQKELETLRKRHLKVE